jgi:hypothetical protein
MRGVPKPAVGVMIVGAVVGVGIGLVLMSAGDRAGGTILIAAAIAGPSGWLWMAARKIRTAADAANKSTPQ